MKLAFAILLGAIASSTASAADLFCQPYNGDKAKIVVHEPFGHRIIPHVNTHGIFGSMDECKAYLEQLSLAVPAQDGSVADSPTVGT